MKLTDLYTVQLESLTRSAKNPRLMRRVIKEAAGMFASHPSTASLIWIQSKYQKSLLKESKKD